MPRRIGAWGAWLLLAAGAGQAQVYKCVDAAGVATYSQKPCGADAAPVVPPGGAATPAFGAEVDYCRTMRPLSPGAGHAAELQALLASTAALCASGAPVDGFKPVLSGNVQLLLKRAPADRQSAWREAWCRSFTALSARGDASTLRHHVEIEPDRTECGRPKSLWRVRDAAGATLLRVDVATEHGSVRIAEH